MRSFSVLALLAAVLTGPGLPGQQSLLVSQGQVLSFSGANGTPTGDPVPGLSNGELFGGTSGSDNAVIDDNGNIFFRAQIVDSAGVAYPTAQAALGRGYFWGDSRGNLVKVLRGGDPEPSGTIPAAILQTSTGGVAFTGSPRISSNGIVMFGATIWDPVGGTITTANDTVLYVGTPGSPGSWQILAREGDIAPGTGGANYSQAFSGMSQQPTGINAAGQVLFQSSLAGAGVVTANNAAWFTGTVGNVQLMLRKGDLAPGGETISALGFISQLNASGQVATEVTLLAGSGPVPVTTTNDKALFIYTPGAGIAQVLREGDAAPFPGVFYSNASATWNFNTGSCTFNAAGELLIHADLLGAVSTGADDRALVKVSTSGQTVVMRRGDAAPGVPGANLDTVNNSSLFLNDSGEIAFQSSLAGGGVTTTNDTGIWAGTPGNLQLVAREGDVAPGSGGQTFGNTTGLAMIMNGAGQVLFNNTLSGGNSSYWSWDPVLGLQAVRIYNDAVEVQPGVFKNSFGNGHIQFTNGDSRPLSFSNDGTAALRVGFLDNTSAMMSVRIASLAGVPRSLSAAAGGVQKLYLNGGLSRAGQSYLMAGTFTGTMPGFPLGAFNVPLNVDSYFTYTVLNPNTFPLSNSGFLLNIDGRELATVTLPAGLGVLAGLTFHHAFASVDGQGGISLVSEAAALSILP